MTQPKKHPDYKWDYAAQLELLIRWCNGRISAIELASMAREEREQLLPETAPSRPTKRGQLVMPFGKFNKAA